MMNPFPGSDMKPLIGTYDTEFAQFASGATAFSVTNLLRRTMGRMANDDRKYLSTVFILAAVTNRRMIDSLLMRQEMGIVNKYLLQYWSIRNTYNFTCLNLVGNMIFAAHVSPGTTLMESYRAKLKGLSIWHTDIATSGLSEASKAIATDRINKTTRLDALYYGSAIIYLLCYGPSGKNNKALPEDLQNFNGELFFRVTNPGNLNDQQGEMNNQHHAGQSSVPPRNPPPPSTEFPSYPPGFDPNTILDPATRAAYFRQQAEQADKEAGRSQEASHDAESSKNNESELPSASEGGTLRREGLRSDKREAAKQGKAGDKKKQRKQ